MPGLSDPENREKSSSPRSSFYWKLSSAFAGIVLLGALFVGLLVRYQLSADLRGELELNLRRTCLVLAPDARKQILAEHFESPDEELRKLGSATGLRLTWIRLDGRVVGDTHAAADLMENHDSRKEFREAMAEGFGRQERASSTIGREMLYVAYALEHEGERIGVIRAAMPLDDIQKQLSRVDRIILVGAALGALGAALCGLFVARQITRPITNITRMAEAVREGDYAARTQDLPHDEIGLLGQAINELSAELTNQLADSSAEKGRLQAVLAGMVEGVVALDDEDRILFSNQTARDFLDIDPTDSPDGRLSEMAELGGLSELIRSARKLSGPARATLSARRDGAELLLDAHATPFGTDEARGIALVLNDVTELRRLELVRSDFVANVSHELKTPLTAIQGYVETLLEGAIHDPDNNIRFLEKVDVHTGRLVHLVSDLLSLARIQSEESVSRLTKVDLVAVVDEVVREKVDEAQKREQKVLVECDDPRVLVMGDRDSLFQVVGNLVENAIKYSPREETIKLALGSRKDHCWLEVRDRGIGIPANEVDRVFERFYRVDKARSRELGGTGLGLSIVKNLVAAMGGRIELTSKLGRGSTFRIELPAPESSS